MSEAVNKGELMLDGVRRRTGEQRRRLSEVRAREHVGAAGWAQTSALEEIIRAGREGLVATDTLRQVVRLTTEQVRSLPLGSAPEAREEQVRTLGEIVQSGEAQITAAEALDHLIRQALEDVVQTPADHLNAHTLRNIQERVQQQLRALGTIVEAARAQASTLEEVARLDRLSAEHQDRVDALHHVSAEEEAQALAEAGEEIVGRIAELDEAPASQLGALAQIGEAVVDHVTETGATPQEQVQALDDLAQTVQQKAGELRGE